MDIPALSLNEKTPQLKVPDVKYPASAVPEKKPRREDPVVVDWDRAIESFHAMLDEVYGKRRGR